MKTASARDHSADQVATWLGELANGDSALSCWVRSVGAEAAAKVIQTTSLGLGGPCYGLFILDSAGNVCDFVWVTAADASPVPNNKDTYPPVWVEVMRGHTADLPRVLGLLKKFLDDLDLNSRLVCVLAADNTALANYLASEKTVMGWWYHNPSYFRSRFMDCSTSMRRLWWVNP